MRCHVIFNSNSGTALETGLTGDDLRDRLVDYGHEATVDADADRPLAERIAEAVASDAEVLVAAGGDGTVTALAGAMIDSDKALAILPMGTANLLARDLAIPLDLDEWLEGSAGMRVRHIDVGFVNGHLFLHKVVIGFVPGIAAGRELLRGRESFVAKLAFMRYFFRRLFRSRRLAVEIAHSDGERRIHRVQAVAVASNAYAEGFARFFSRPRLDAGILTLYILKHLSVGDLLRLCFGFLLGRWRSDDALQVESVEDVTIRSRKKSLNVMLDGEIVAIEPPLAFSIRPGALKVLAPPVATDDETIEGPASVGRES
ncbi:diacylglycerol kinase [Chelativorans sp. ZYF759]|uniref:diacylglycerol/lipid kinase family protein n=1 Tax=Chelativorans sp. ZYF759 TaxID=2692213 RepID=UPI00145D697E|nr:diacylglycerol kinase family protein [Chelativorans sp. ZYF759]NMG41211.1 diacylglycerol kinase [Chelativorans sp. ZYF759]